VEALSPSSLHKQFTHSSREGKAQLQILTQPEQQHRARYQTEGSRGAVKDRSGNGFPVVKLNGYNKPTTLQVKPTFSRFSSRYRHSNAF
jgi:nuclear factor of activated T-cells 5